MLCQNHSVYPNSSWKQPRSWESIVVAGYNVHYMLNENVKTRPAVRRVFGVRGHEGGVRMRWLGQCPFRSSQRARSPPFAPPTMWGYKKNLTSCNPKEGPYQYPAMLAPDPRLQPPELWEINFCCVFKSPSLWHFLIAACLGDIVAIVEKIPNQIMWENDIFWVKLE